MCGRKRIVWSAAVAFSLATPALWLPSHSGERTVSAAAAPTQAPIDKTSIVLRPPDRRDAARRSLPQLGNEYLGAAVREVLQMEDPVEREVLLNGVLEEWILEDAEAAAAFAYATEASPLRDDLLRRVINRWVRTNTAAAFIWADAILDAEDRRAVFHYACQALARRDPRQAMQAALDRGFDREPNSLLDVLAVEWARQDFSTALNWTRQLPKGETREQLTGRLAQVLAHRDPVHATRLVLEMSPGPVLEEAAISVLHQWSLRDLEAATGWAVRFAEGTLRERALAELEASARAQLAAAPFADR